MYYLQWWTARTIWNLWALSKDVGLGDKGDSMFLVVCSSSESMVASIPITLKYIAQILFYHELHTTWNFGFWQQIMCTIYEIKHPKLHNYKPQKLLNLLWSNSVQLQYHQSVKPSKSLDKSLQVLEQFFSVLLLKNSPALTRKKITSNKGDQLNST